MTHTSDRLALISQEQEYQANSLVELRQAVTGLTRDVRRLEKEIATLRAAWVASAAEEKQPDASDNASYAVTILEDWWTETGVEGAE